MNNPMQSAENTQLGGDGADALAKDSVRGIGIDATLETLQRLGRYEEMEQIYREMLVDQPNDSTTLHNLGLLFQSQGQLAEAEHAIRHAIEAAPAKPAFHNSLGVVLRSLGRVEEAEACYRHALELWDAYFEARYNLGVLLEANGRMDEALASYLAVVELQPNDARALTRVGAILNQRGSLDDARQYLQMACKADPEYFDAHYYHGWVLSSLKRHDEALRALSRAEALKPQSTEVIIARAHALQGAGRFNEALDANWRVLEMEPDRAATHEEINKLAWLAGRQDLYLRSFEFARQQKGDLPELLCLEAAFHLRRNDFLTAEQLTRKACAFAPDSGEALGMLARSLAGQRKFPESFDLFARAISLQPAVSLHWQEFGFSLLRAGMPKDALTVFERAVASDMSDQLILAGMTLAFRALGDERYQQLADFSKYVRVYDLHGSQGPEEGERFNRALAAELDALHVAQAEPIDQTVRGGTQTTEHLFAERSPAIQQLKTRFDAAVGDYVGNLPDEKWHPMAVRKAGRFGYSGSWSCRLMPGGYHQNHVHPRGWISSVYYARLPQPSADPNSREGWLKFGESNFAMGEWDRPNQLVRPVVGRLVLFPSFFWHGTIPFTDQGDRLTVAFDVTPEVDAVKHSS